MRPSLTLSTCCVSLRDTLASPALDGQLFGRLGPHRRSCTGICFLDLCRAERALSEKTLSCPHSSIMFHLRQQGVVLPYSILACVSWKVVAWGVLSPTIRLLSPPSSNMFQLRQRLFDFVPYWRLSLGNVLCWACSLRQGFFEAHTALTMFHLRQRIVVQHYSMFCCPVGLHVFPVRGLLRASDSCITPSLPFVSITSRAIKIHVSLDIYRRWHIFPHPLR